MLSIGKLGRGAEGYDAVHGRPAHDGRLSSQLAFDDGGMTRLVDRITDAGYVERRPCATDRRVWFAGITEDRQRKLEAAASVAPRCGRCSLGFSADELVQLDTLLDHLRS